MTPDPELTPEQRRLLGEAISASRAELEELMDKLEAGIGAGFEQTGRSSVITLLREARASAVQVWHRINSETDWPGTLRGPIPIASLSPLIQGAMAQLLEALEIQTRLVVETGPLMRLCDRDFADGTALELSVGEGGSESFPLGRLGLALAPGDHWVALLVSGLVGRRQGVQEWPKRIWTQSKIGPLEAARWDRGSLQAFLQEVLGRFHADVAEEIRARSPRPRGSLR
ncbi:hypothetical protein JXA47_05850 [Candidatus Sumerlaeota bacterium]|nr:hypothetical protein [Candidatus Sumerlaeota bacterium]